MLRRAFRVSPAAPASGEPGVCAFRVPGEPGGWCSSSLALAGGLVSDGTIGLGSYAGGGALTVAGTLTQRHGELSMQQSTLSARRVVIGLGARLAADGTIAGNLVNDGAVAVAGQLPLSGN